MVPASVADKWPTEWAVFAERCLRRGHGLRASGQHHVFKGAAVLIGFGPAVLWCFGDEAGSLVKVWLSMPHLNPGALRAFYSA
jgi:hypothetical protein